LSKTDPRELERRDKKIKLDFIVFDVSCESCLGQQAEVE
jgi:hypothetical protein